ncbi:hypothetical protein H1P_730014 [Hyella patelloides LEGE 07179]|uniref:Uncharacterized protein n=1 Tax=Hyella patelloides LEGE 07179 TaxID=945734 RepID=A0A563W3Z9_9CYAN|nr:hypothetical protein H1P_730014 [Hyella patelloides LEGE 07179]
MCFSSDLAGTQLVAETDYTFDLNGRLTDLTHLNNSEAIATYDYTGRTLVLKLNSLIQYMPDNHRGHSEYNPKWKKKNYYLFMIHLLENQSKILM